MAGYNTTRTDIASRHLNFPVRKMGVYRLEISRHNVLHSMVPWIENIEQILESTPAVETPNITDAETLFQVCLRDCCWCRAPERKAPSD